MLSITYILQIHINSAALDVIVVITVTIAVGNFISCFHCGCQLVNADISVLLVQRPEF